MEALYSFGPFALDRERGALLRDGRPVRLGHRAFSVLAVLAERGGQAVPMADLMARVWRDTFVEEGNLAVQIALLRKALGEAPDGENWILTVPRVGYRLRAALPTPDESVDPPDLPRVAVLPFRNLGPDEGPAYFADGVVEDLITALSRFRSFTVVSRPASSAQGEIDTRQLARDVSARYVLEGTTRRAGDRLRLTAKLVESESGAPLWAEQFDGVLDDVFEFQDRITENVATLIAPRIQAAEIRRSRRERPGSFAVYDLYLQALAKIANETEHDNAEAHDLLARGLTDEPSNALLLALAAWVVEHRLAMGWTPFGPDDRRLCGELARRGLEHADGDAVTMV